MLDCGGDLTSCLFCSSSCELFKHTKLVEDEADGLTALLVAGQWGDIGAIAEILENRPVGGQKILKAAKTAMKILDAPSVDDDQAAQVLLLFCNWKQASIPLE